MTALWERGCHMRKNCGRNVGVVLCVCSERVARGSRWQNRVMVAERRAKGAPIPNMRLWIIPASSVIESTVQI